MPSPSIRTPPRPRPESGIVNREVYTDPSEDIAREQARMVEATPGGAHGQYPNSTSPSGQHASNGSASAPRSGKRQDFSNEKFSKKDNKLGDYFLGKTLGAGEFAKVRIGWKLDGGVEVAVKMISKAGLDNRARLDKVEREIAILKTVNHPNIIKMHEIVETSRIIGIVMEYASQGELFEYIARERYLRDSAARRLFAQLVSGVGYLHEKGIIHRDLKLENLLLDRNHNLIITDFGFANSFDPMDELGERVESNLHRRSFIKKYDLETLHSNGFRRGDLMATSCGSPCYAAPELVVSDTIYTGRKVDVWSCGVILYAMLAGYLPFDDDPSNPEGDNINLLYKYIVSAPLVFPEHVTPHARDLLRRILVPDPRKRADLFEVARHSWLSDFAHVVEGVTSAAPAATAAARAAVGADGYGLPPPLTRSASVREATKIASAPSPVGGLTTKHGKQQVSQDAERRPTPREVKRRTLQLEYVAPQSQTTRPEASSSAAAYAMSPTNNRYPTSSVTSEPQRTKAASDGPSMKSPARKPVPSSAKTTARPVRDLSRAASDSNALGFTTSLSSYTTTPPAAARPTTQGSMNGSMSGTSRLPQRGSYGLPSVATVAPTNVQGRISQPPPSRGKIDSIPPGPTEPELASPSAVGSEPVQDVDNRQTRRDPSVAADAAQQKHKRNSTFSILGDRLFGRSNSKSVRTGADEKRRTMELARGEPQQQFYEPSQGGSWKLAAEQPHSPRPARPDRAYPPSSMRPVNTEEPAPRRSTESTRRSFGFSRKSFDLSLGTREKRASRRFSFIPRLGSKIGKEQEYRPPTSDVASYSPLDAAAVAPAAVHRDRDDASGSAAGRDGTLDVDPRSRYEQFQTYDREASALPTQMYDRGAISVPIQRTTPRGGGFGGSGGSGDPGVSAGVGNSSGYVNNISSRPAEEPQAAKKLEKRAKPNDRDQRKRYSGVEHIKEQPHSSGGGMPPPPPPPSSSRKTSTTSKVMGFLRGRRQSQAV